MILKRISVGRKKVKQALEILAKATNRDDYDELQGPLWNASKEYSIETIEAFSKYPQHQHSIAWCLSHVKSNSVKEFFIREHKNKDQYIRGYAISNLRKYQSKKLIAIFLSGLKDRSVNVKFQSLEAVKSFRDETIKKQLVHLITLKSIKSHPGILQLAIDILRKNY